LLYRDFWDLKQPGSFYFYLLATRLFGSGSVSVHALELIGWIALTAAQIAALASSLRRPLLAALRS